MSNKRIIALSEKVTPDSGDFFVMDNSSGGTKKYKVKKILDQIAENAEDISDLKSEIEQMSGLSEDVKTALLQLASKVAYIDADGQDYYDDLYDALYPPVDLDSISCVYTQSGTVYDSASLDDLKADLVVTAHYSDSTTETVTTYVLSGTLTAGTSTITVTYGGKTTTFDVTVTATPSVYPMTLTDQSDGVGFGPIDSTKNTVTPPYISGTGKNRFHCIGNNTGYPVTYGKSYRVTISGMLGTEYIAPQCFNAAGLTELQNTQKVTATNKNEPTGGWLLVDNQTFTFTPTQINGTDPVCMWLNFKNDSGGSGQWTDVNQMLPITIEEISGV